MSRYIDADAFRQELIFKQLYCRDDIAERYALGIVIAKLDSTPTADVVEVVRCKDCEYYIRPDRGYPYCSIMSNEGEGEYYTPFDDHYCSHGERREENDKTE